MLVCSRPLTTLSVCHQMPRSYEEAMKYIEGLRVLGRLSPTITSGLAASTSGAASAVVVAKAASAAATATPASPRQ
jgi:hypothetical protein